MMKQDPTMEQASILYKESAYVEYFAHENGIHEFVFLQANRVAVDRFFAMMRIWTQQQNDNGITPDDIIRLIVDFRRSGTPPMNYIFQSSKAFRVQFPVDRCPRSFSATLLQPGFLVSVAQSFNRLLTNLTRDRIAIYSGDNAHEQAVTWLLKEK
jgi:hypothetical protein